MPLGAARRRRRGRGAVRRRPSSRSCAARASRTSPSPRRPASSTSASRASRRVSTPRTRRAPSQLMAMRLVYQGLVAFGERGDIEPALATAWTVSRDGLVWTFRLRQDVQLHDGAPLGLDEVVAALDRADLRRRAAGRRARLGPAVPRRGPDRPRGAARRGGVDPDRRSRSRTRRCSRSSPTRRSRSRFRGPAVRGSGSGPYRAVELTADRLDARGGADLARGAAAERAARPARGQPTTRRRSPGLGPGPLHAALVGAPPAWAAVGLQVVSGPTWRVGLLALRTDRGLTSKKTVRQAVALALDPGLLNPALGRWAAPHAAWLPPGAWAVRDAGPLLFDAAQRAAAARAGRADRPDADAARVGAGLGSRGRRRSPRRSGFLWAPPDSRCVCSWRRPSRPTARRDRAPRS